MFVPYPSPPPHASLLQRSDRSASHLAALQATQSLGGFLCRLAEPKPAHVRIPGGSISSTLCLLWGFCGAGQPKCISPPPPPPSSPSPNPSLSQESFYQGGFLNGAKTPEKGGKRSPFGAALFPSPPRFRQVLNFHDRNLFRAQSWGGKEMPLSLRRLPPPRPLSLKPGPTQLEQIDGSRRSEDKSCQIVPSCRASSRQEPSPS